MYWRNKAQILSAMIDWVIRGGIPNTINNLLKALITFITYDDIS